MSAVVAVMAIWNDDNDDDDADDDDDLDIYEDDYDNGDDDSDDDVRAATELAVFMKWRSLFFNPRSVMPEQAHQISKIFEPRPSLIIFRNKITEDCYAIE